MAAQRLRRLMHTVRWLRPVQIYGRAWFRFVRPRPDLRPAPPRRPLPAGWRACARAPSVLAADTLRFVGVTRQLAAPSDWNRGDWPKLWLYNAHYFDDLVADDAAARADWHRALVARWMQDNPPGEGNGWEPYPTSLRIVNWVKWMLAAPEVVDASTTHSLAIQARWLRRRLEHHLLGNHLWANAKALVFAGTWFAGPEAEAWRARGLALIRRELAEQVLEDGGHFERSPMYHAIVLEDLLDLIQLAGHAPEPFAAVVDRWRDTALRMLRWLATMDHPDGGIGFFNDAAFGIAPAFAALRAYADALDLPATDAPGTVLLQPSGYARLQAAGAVLLADVAPVGPDYIPGHAHADTLSFELSVAGRRVLVNSGTSTYEVGPERQRQRGTAAHNTVVVDGEDSSEVWSSFRVARRARVAGVRLHEDGDEIVLEACHDGYRRLPGDVVHRREWRLRPGGLSVVDRLDGRFAVAEARFHFAPGAQIGWSAEGGTGTLERATWHPRFGESWETQVLVVRFAGPKCEVRFHWG